MSGAIHTANTTTTLALFHGEARNCTQKIHKAAAKFLHDACVVCNATNVAFQVCNGGNGVSHYACKNCADDAFQETAGRGGAIKRCVGVHEGGVACRCTVIMEPLSAAAKTTSKAVGAVLQASEKQLDELNAKWQAKHAEEMSRVQQEARASGMRAERQRSAEQKSKKMRMRDCRNATQRAGVTKLNRWTRRARKDKKEAIAKYFWTKLALDAVKELALGRGVAEEELAAIEAEARAAAARDAEAKAQAHADAVAHAAWEPDEEEDGEEEQVEQVEEEDMEDIPHEELIQMPMADRWADF